MTVQTHVLQVGDKVEVIAPHTLRGKLWAGKKECVIGDTGTVTRANGDPFVSVAWDTPVGARVSSIDTACLKRLPGPSDKAKFRKGDRVRQVGIYRYHNGKRNSNKFNEGTVQSIHVGCSTGNNICYLVSWDSTEDHPNPGDHFVDEGTLAPTGEADLDYVRESFGLNPAALIEGLSEGEQAAYDRGWNDALAKVETALVSMRVGKEK